MSNPKFVLGAALVLVGVFVIASFVLGWLIKAIMIGLAIAAVYVGLRIMTKSSVAKSKSSTDPEKEAS